MLSNEGENIISDYSPNRNTIYNSRHNIQNFNNKTNYSENNQINNNNNEANINIPKPKSTLLLKISIALISTVVVTAIVVPVVILTNKEDEEEKNNNDIASTNNIQNSDEIFISELIQSEDIQKDTDTKKEETDELNESVTIEKSDNDNRKII